MHSQLGAAMESEMREQPLLLRSVYQRYREFFASLDLQDNLALIVGAGRGSSDNALMYGRYLAEVNAKIPFTLAAPSVLTLFGSKIRYTNALGIGISQSGVAPDVAAVLNSMGAQNCGTIAITNDSGSLVAESARWQLDLGVGRERALAATKTFTASLLALYCFVNSISECPALRLPDESDFEIMKALAESCADDLLSAPLTMLLGRGYAFSSALEGALKIMECALLPCKCYSTADFEHGPKALLNENTFVICYSSAPEIVKNAGAKYVELCPGAESDVSSPLMAAFFSQWLALSVARARNINPDSVKNLSKVTRTL